VRAQRLLPRSDIVNVWKRLVFLAAFLAAFLALFVRGRPIAERRIA
jgi:hypothetical protein